MWKKVNRNENYSVNENGEVMNNITNQMKKPTLNKRNGYLMVDLYKNNKREKVPVHRLVAEAFLDNPDAKPTVDHIDGNRENNKVTNLRWASYSEQNSRFETVGVRAQCVKCTHYDEIRKKRGGGHLDWGEIIEVVEFSSISACADYFQCTISNISLRLESGEIGLRGKTRAWKIEYTDSKRHTYQS